MADPILVTDPSGKILLMNSPAERLFTAPAADETTEAERAVRSNDAHFSSFVSNLFLTGGGLRWRGEISLTDPDTLQPLPVEAVAGQVRVPLGQGLAGRIAATREPLIVDDMARADPANPFLRGFVSGFNARTVVSSVAKRSSATSTSLPVSARMSDDFPAFV